MLRVQWRLAACLALAGGGEASLLAGVNEERAARTVRELCALGPRMGGTSSGDKAAELLAKRFAELGLEVSVVEDPARWCHEETRWSVTASRGETSSKVLSAWPYGFSPPGSGGGVLALERKQGAAFLTASRPSRVSDPNVPVLVLVDGIERSEASFPMIGELAAGPDNPFPVFAISRSDGALLRTWLQSEGLPVTVHYELETSIERRNPKTVIARLRPKNAAEAASPSPYLLYCAHGDSDSGGPGANDNASGVAILLEIAAAWTRALREGELDLPCELRFAVWGTEIHSSRAFLKRCERPEDRPLAVINYDQAGFGSAFDHLYIEPDDLSQNRELILRLHAALSEQRGSNGLPERWATNKSQGGTDSYIFSNEGWVAITLYTSAWNTPAELACTPGMPGQAWSPGETVHIDYDDYYHTAGDVPENTTDREPFNMGYCARAGLLASLGFPSRPEAVK